MCPQAQRGQARRRPPGPPRGLPDSSRAPDKLVLHHGRRASCPGLNRCRHRRPIPPPSTSTPIPSQHPTAVIRAAALPAVQVLQIPCALRRYKPCNPGLPYLKTSSHPPGIGPDGCRWRPSRRSVYRGTRSHHQVNQSVPLRRHTSSIKKPNDTVAPGHGVEIDNSTNPFSHSLSPP